MERLRGLGKWKIEAVTNCEFGHEVGRAANDAVDNGIDRRYDEEERPNSRPDRNWRRKKLLAEQHELAEVSD